jgi:hypothetical protein
VRFLLSKGLSTKDIDKEMSPAYGGKCLSCEAVRNNWVQKRGKCFVDEEVEPEIRKWLRQQLKPRWDKCINVGGRYVEI